MKRSRTATNEDEVEIESVDTKTKGVVTLILLEDFISEEDARRNAGLNTRGDDEISVTGTLKDCFALCCFSGVRFNPLGFTCFFNFPFLSILLLFVKFIHCEIKKKYVDIPYLLNELSVEITV